MMNKGIFRKFVMGVYALIVTFAFENSSIFLYILVKEWLMVLEKKTFYLTLKKWQILYAYPPFSKIPSAETGIKHMGSITLT